MPEPLLAPTFNAPATVSADTPKDVPRIRRGQRVWCGDRRVGHVRLLRSTSAGQVHSFVLRRGVVRHRDVIVPMAWVSVADGRRVQLTVERDELDTLPAYYGDRALGDAVGRALSADPRLRAQGDDGIAVSVESGIVHARHGVVYLSCDAAGQEVRMAAQACAAGIPHVRGIVNAIQAPGVVLDADAQRVLQPRIGQQIYAPGQSLGTVEHVVISPLRCTVTAIVARVPFEHAAHPDASERFDLAPLRDRRVVIPIAAVRAVTPSAVLLRISGDEAAGCDEFEQGRFVAPLPSWEPPYPYTRGHVLLDRVSPQESAPLALRA